jgi:type II secretory pathway pseudopilin PulG
MGKYKLKKNKGFTLIELIVSTAIFMTIMLIAMGSLIMVSNTARKSTALNFTMDNLNFAMESMSRSLRMGTNYYCANEVPTDGLTVRDCEEGERAISFIPAEDDGSTRRISYKQEDDIIQRCIGSEPCVDIISPNIKIDFLKFFVRGSVIDNETQPGIYMLVKGTVTIKNEPKSFAIQTMISQRTLE